ncbi:MAG: NAD kinase [Cyclobacteriaceae bacterium]
MSKVALHGRRINDDSVVFVQNILQILENHSKDIFFSPELSDLLKAKGVFADFPIYTPRENMESFEVILSLGGDGTLLDTLTHVGDTQLPILGINLGRLGFLAVISKDNIDVALESYFQGKYEYDDRSLLFLDSPTEVFGDGAFALNEFAILRKDTSSMIVVKCFVDGEFLNTYWADGLMIATPTGSTGYSLSCGGPVIMPNTKNFIITPISPHNLNVRPLIIPENSELMLQVESSNPSYQVSMDSRSVSVEEILEFRIKKAPFPCRLIKINGSSFLDTLRGKLTWGLDKRN